MNTLECLTQFYTEHCDEDSRLRSRHGMVEFLTTMRYVEKYLFSGARIMEIGAGTGRYSHALAQQGYQVDAVELIEHNIRIFREKTQPGENVTIRQGNAKDLSCFGDDTFDMTLLLGPMYHLFTVAEQKQAIRVTKSCGLIYAAYCGNEATMIQYCFGRGMIRDPHLRSKIDPVTFKASSDPAELFQLYRREDIDELLEGFSVERLHYVGTDLATNYMRQTVDEMDDALFDLYLKHHFSICERSDLVGASHHMLDILRKE